MKNLKKVSRENLKSITGGYGAPVSDGAGGWYCPKMGEVICLQGCTAMCMTPSNCKRNLCIDPVFG
ncbi:bacteriocin-like protein [Chryseobacterium kwangjuense]|uniref:bacteriocin-like protein n=1 Tax=Chryseobacterium kwangjuense TaxID=267125 RepID=UPI000ACBAD6E|nr:hypothetical protein [Chryseobacterium kwangjuense]